MGDETAADENQYKIIRLEQPWGETNESVRLFPPCQVKDSVFRGHGPVLVFVQQNGAWRRKRVGPYDLWPRDGFIAWDDTNSEYSWHEVGTIDVPTAQDPRLFKPIIRGETEPIGDHPTKDPRARGRRKRRTFTEWWSSKSRDDYAPDFLNRDA